MIQLFSRESIESISLSTYDYSAKAFGTDQNMTQIAREATTFSILI